MDLDVTLHLGAVQRSIKSLERDGQPARAVALERTYPTSVDDLWDAITNGERIPRWFLPVSGDLRLGGRYQLKGNAGGEITDCDPPSYLAVTWQFGGAISWVEVRLAAEGKQRARLTLIHTAPVSDHWNTYGPGAVGVGWELGLLGLAMYLDRPDAEKPDEAAFAASPVGRQFIVGSSEDWGRASISGGTEASAALAAAGRTTAFYLGETAPGG